MVSIWAGEITRTWEWKGSNKIYYITLIHDLITGVRGLTINGEEVIGSVKVSHPLTIFRTGCDIPFQVDGKSGRISIYRHGIFNVTYYCIVDHMVLIETTQVPQPIAPNMYSATIIEAIPLIGLTGKSVIWFNIEVKRDEDGIVNRVCRRFREFVELDKQVRQALRGSHLESRIPLLPTKHLKMIINHEDARFIEDRRNKLAHYLQQLLQIPLVESMQCVQIFLGIIENVREYSMIFDDPIIGVTFEYQDSDECIFPAVVKGFRDNLALTGIAVGDFVSKIHGICVTNMSFDEVIDFIKLSDRPLLLHFIQDINESQENDHH